MRTVLLVISFILCFSPFLAVPLVPSKVLFAIDSGAVTSVKSALGFLYQKFPKDEGFSTSRVADYSSNQDLAHIRMKYTFDQTIYMTERHHDDSFSYDVPIPKDGKFTLILKFAEMYFREHGKRVFNVKLGEKTVIEDLDIVANVGPFAANDEYIEFELKDDQIYHNGELCPKALKVKSQKLIVTLEKGKMDLPIISGLVLYDGGLEETDYSDIPEFRNQWQAKIDEELRAEEEERQMKLQQKKKALESLGEGLFEFQDYQEDRMNAIIRIMLSKEGAVIIGALLSCAVLLLVFGEKTEKKEL